MFIDNEDKVDITGPHPFTAETKHHQTTPNLRVTGNDMLLSNKLRPACPHSKEQAHRKRSAPTQLYLLLEMVPTPMKYKGGWAPQPFWGLLERKESRTDVGNRKNSGSSSLQISHCANLAAQVTF